MHTPMFSLQDSIAALELMDPKMVSSFLLLAVPLCVALTAVGSKHDLCEYMPAQQLPHLLTTYAALRAIQNEQSCSSCQACLGHWAITLDRPPLGSACLHTQRERVVYHLAEALCCVYATCNPLMAGFWHGQQQRRPHRFVCCGNRGKQ